MEGTALGDSASIYFGALEKGVAKKKEANRREILGQRGAEAKRGTSGVVNRNRGENEGRKEGDKYQGKKLIY